MAKKPFLNEIQIQKRLLIARSEIHRQTLNTEIQNIKDSTAWIGKTASILRKSLPFVAAGAPLAGILLAKNRKQLQSLPSKAIWGLQLARFIGAFWKGFRAGGRKTDLSEEQVFSKHFRPG